MYKKLWHETFCKPSQHIPDEQNLKKIWLKKSQLERLVIIIVISTLCSNSTSFRMNERRGVADDWTWKAGSIRLIRGSIINGPWHAIWARMSWTIIIIFNVWGHKKSRTNLRLSPTLSTENSPGSSEGKSTK